MLSEGNDALPVGCDSPLQIVMAVWHPFCLNFNFLGWVQQPSADNYGAPNGYFYLQRAVTPDQIAQENSFRGQECPKGRKGILRPDFQINIKPRIFFKANVTTRYWKTGNLSIVSLRQFCVDDA
jgi:hypothetical protein